MALVTLQVLEGLERGRLFEDLSTPVSIGREDDNSIRLNDERVSRFHAKIQEDSDRIILTDLDSTNGTRVNGHPSQLRVLQHGDHVLIGRCLLLYGSPEQIEKRVRYLSRLAPERHTGVAQNVTMADVDGDPGATLGLTPQRHAEYGDLFPAGAPELPTDLRGVQRAQLSDILNFAHDRIRTVLESACDDPENPGLVMHVNWVAWQMLARLEMDLATYLRRVAEPDE